MIEFSHSYRVAITGPESTGKSALSMKLANYFHTGYVPEYARSYIDLLDRPYTEQDILVIAKGQLEEEEVKAKETNGLLFCDTEFLVAKIWSDVKYGRCHPWIRHTLETHIYDLYLLCNIDLPWEEDPQREHPHLRQHLFDLYHQALLQYGWNFRIISGFGEERIGNAINAINTGLLNK